MFTIARPTCCPDLSSDSSSPYYLIAEYHEDQLMENMDDPQDFFDKVDDPGDRGVTHTPLRIPPRLRSLFWPKVTANAGRGGWGMRNESFLLLFVPHTCVSPELNPSFRTGANWCAIQKKRSLLEASTLALKVGVLDYTLP